MLKVLIAEDLWWPVPEDFGHTYDVVYDADLYMDTEKLGKCGKNMDALIVRNKTKVSRDLLDKFPFLKVVGRLGVGLDNIDLDACKSKGVTVVAARGFNANAVAEYVFASMFERARFLRESDRVTKEGIWDRRRGTGTELGGKKLGLIGVGEIGQRVAIRARAMAMEVLVYDPFLLDSNLVLQDGIVKRVELEQLFREADYLSIHVPLMPETHHLISRPELELMKDNVVIINTSRGGIINETALAISLHEHPDQFAVLDVREQEPPSQDDELLRMRNVLLTPHIAGITRESSRGVAQFILQQVDNNLQGRLCQGVVV